MIWATAKGSDMDHQLSPEGRVLMFLGPQAGKPPMSRRRGSQEGHKP